MRKTCNLHERSCQASCFFLFVFYRGEQSRDQEHTVQTAQFERKKRISNNIWRSGRCHFVSLGSVEDFITSIIKWPSPPAISDIIEWCLLMQHCRAADILTDLHSAGHGRKLPTCFQTTAHNHQVISTNTVPWGIVLVQRYGKQSIRERDTNYIHFHFCVV